MVALSQYGWSFFFPDERDSQSLQRVGIADNAGLIGQNPEQDLGSLIKTRTPPGSFVVAQIFIGDPNYEPLATCISQPTLVTRFVPTYYSGDWSWLDRGRLGYWLKYKK